MSDTPSPAPSVPFLLRVFWKLTRHHDASHYRSLHSNEGVSECVSEAVCEEQGLPDNQVQLYMFEHSTLREVAASLLPVLQPALTTSLTHSHSACQLDVSTVFVKPDGRPLMKHVACVSLEAGTDKDRSKGVSECGSESKGVLEQLGDAGKTLRQLRVRPGDVLDVAVLVDGGGGGQSSNVQSGGAPPPPGVRLGGGKGRGRRQGNRGKKGGGGGRGAGRDQRVGDRSRGDARDIHNSNSRRTLRDAGMNDSNSNESRNRDKRSRY